jgi:hypothetical protein
VGKLNIGSLLLGILVRRRRGRRGGGRRRFFILFVGFGIDAVTEFLAVDSENATKFGNSGQDLLDQVRARVAFCEIVSQKSRFDLFLQSKKERKKERGNFPQERKLQQHSKEIQTRAVAAEERSLIETAKLSSSTEA